jgi:hypothetical protein
MSLILETGAAAAPAKLASEPFGHAGRLFQKSRLGRRSLNLFRKKRVKIME